MLVKYSARLVAYTAYSNLQSFDVYLKAYRSLSGNQEFFLANMMSI